MKLVEESMEYLNKAGSILPYFYKKGDELNFATFYNFTTEDGDKYSVRFFNIGEIQNKQKNKDKYTIDFVVGKKNGDFVVVNKGRFYRVMSTVIDIMDDFAKEKDPKVLQISPSENYKRDKRRYHIYQRYIEKFIPPSYHFKKGMFDDNLYIIKN